MCDARRTISLGFTDEPMPEGMHICYIYDDETERQQVISRFLESGLQANEKVLCLAESETGIDLEEPRPGALTVLDSVRGYCPSGIFRPEETLDLIRDFYHRAVDQEGYAGARGTGQMGWSLDGKLATEEELIGYEAKVNSLLAEHPCTACCQYDARLFSGQTIMDVLSIHPMVIIRGQIIKNPYYVDPDVFLKEYHART